MRDIPSSARSWAIFRRCALAAVGVMASLAASPTMGQDTGRKDGLVLTIPNPIKSETVDLVRKRIADAANLQKRPLETVVFDFNPNDLPAGANSFGSCLELAEFIRGLQLGEPGLPRVSTVAYVHKAVAKHTVLPVLACGQIVFGPDGGLGDVPSEDLAKPTVVAAYREQAKYHPSPDLIRRVFDPDFALKRVKTPLGERIVAASVYEEWLKQGKEVAVHPREIRGLDPGQSLIDAETARESGLARAILDSRGEVVDALGLSRRSLAEDWLVDRPPIAWRIEVRGPLDAGKLQSLERRIRQAVGRNANIIILQLDAEAGDVRVVGAAAKELLRLKDNTGTFRVRTIAWAPPGRSLGSATFLALASTEIVMGRDSALGDFHYLPPDERKAVADALLPLAKIQGYPTLLFRATLEPGLGPTRVRSKGVPSAPMRLETAADFEADQKSADPRLAGFGALVPGEGGSLRVSADLAREFHVAASVDVDTVEALYAMLGLDAATVRVSRDDILDRIAEFFRDPIVNFVLVMVGIIGLILEVKMPGTTFPGTIAAICFVLFFWAYSFVGEFTLLAVLLFLLGLIMIGIEIFAIPGFTFVGLAGIVLVLCSLGLVTLDRWPTTSHEWIGLGSTIATFGVSLVAAVVGAIALTYYLPTMPYASRLVLKPPTGEASDDVAGAVPTSLLGAVGVAVSTLRPAGKAQFGDKFFDVVAEGDFVEPGKRLQIIEIEGNRIVVKEI